MTHFIFSIRDEMLLAFSSTCFLTCFKNELLLQRSTSVIKSTGVLSKNISIAARFEINGSQYILCEP